MSYPHPVSSIVAVIGGGAWGTALAAHSARLGHEVRLWAREANVVQDITERRENALFLPGIPLPEMMASTDAEAVLEHAEIVLLVPPSSFLRSVVEALAPFVPATARIAVATKGIENESLELMLDVAAEALGRSSRSLAVLSGPSFAREVAMGLPTDIVVASHDDAVAASMQSVLHAPLFRTYTSRDPVGVEVGGALKNVLAVAAGACDGLGLGANARAAVVTRGLSEMARLGVALGGDPLTFMGLSGVGDLILTATGALSRNRSLGLKVAEGVVAANWLGSQLTVAEGYSTAKAAYALACKHGVEVPITEQVFRVLHEGRPLLDAMHLLMNRSQKSELWGFDGIARVPPRTA